MKYLVTHQDTIEAATEEEAVHAYIENWKLGFYDEDDLTVEEETERGTK